MRINFDPLMDENKVFKTKADLRLGTCTVCKYGIFQREEYTRHGVDVMHSYCFERVIS